MKKIVVLGMLFAVVFTACENDAIVGNGPIVTKEIIIANFKGIQTYGDDIVQISYGETQKVTITGHANIIDNLERDVNNGMWKIELKDGNYKNAQLTINIVLPLLNYVELQGSGSVEVANFESDANVTIEIDGSGNITLKNNIGCENLAIDIEGSGAIHALGNFENLINLIIEMDGSGAYNGFPNSTLNCAVEISGSSTCNVTVETEMDVDILGSGVVNYKGNPTIHTNIIGSGKLNDFND